MSMASSPSHRSSHSLASNGSLGAGMSTPDMKQQRRMTSPSLPPPGALNLPEHQPPSPLRNGITLDAFTGGARSEDGSPYPEDDDGRSWGQRSHSPTPSISQFASNIAQRVGSLVSNMSPRSPRMQLSDAELEAEAERERERGRREAERILMREAQELRQVEERMAGLLNPSRGSSPRSMPSRSQTMPLPQEPPSPATSQKEGGGWWSAAKNRLTPTKEPLTPAQQIIQETKQREKEKKKARDKSPGNGKYEDPFQVGLMAPPSASQRQTAPSYSPVSIAPARPNFSSNTPTLYSNPGDSTSNSPSREPVPLYAQFNTEGTLDVHGTLLTIAKRFEKLEKWTVGHVRALEERMADVERWLVDKEKEKEQKEQNGASTDANVEVHEIREELVELQARLGEMGREMAKMATAPMNLSSGPSRNSASVTSPPQTTSSIATRALPSVPAESGPVSPTSTPPTHRPQPSSSGSVVSLTSSRTRLPYPTGDYTSPEPDLSLMRNSVSPVNSPPASVNSRPRPTSVAGLPHTSSSGMFSSTPSPSGLPRSDSPVSRALSPPGRGSVLRPSSISPTPRKRYTVALGAPVTAPPDSPERPPTPHSLSPQSNSLGTAYFSSSPEPGATSSDDVDTKPADSLFANHWTDNDETIGKSASNRISRSPSGPVRAPSSTNASPRTQTSPRPSPSASNLRIRAQSTYGPPSGHSSVSPSPIAPRKSRVRSQSTDRFGLNSADSMPATPTSGSGKFVDPLVVRKQTKDAFGTPITPKVGAMKKVPVGELVAFFDGDRQK